RAAQARGFQPRVDGPLRLRSGEAVQGYAGIGRLDSRAIVGKGGGQLAHTGSVVLAAYAHLLQPTVGGQHHGLNGEVEFTRKFEVPLIVSRYGHDRAGPVADQHIVGDPDGDALAVDRVDRITSGEHAALFSAPRDAVFLAHRCDALPIALDLGALRLCGDSVHNRVLGSQHYVACAKWRVGPG